MPVIPRRCLLCSSVGSVHTFGSNEGVEEHIDVLEYYLGVLHTFPRVQYPSACHIKGTLVLTWLHAVLL